MAKYAPKHSEVSGGAKPRPTFSGHKATRLAVTAATTIAMTGSSLLAPFSAFANDASDTTAQDAIMSPLAVRAGEAAGSAVKANDFYPVFRRLVGMDDAVELVEVLLQEGRGLALVVHDIAYVHRWGVC